MLTGSGTPTQTGSGIPMLTGSGTPILAGPWMSVLTLTGHAMPTLLRSSTACSNYLFNFLFMVLSISNDLLELIVFLICSYNEIDYVTCSHQLAQC